MVSPDPNGIGLQPYIHIFNFEKNIFLSFGGDAFLQIFRPHEKMCRFGNLRSEKCEILATFVLLRFQEIPQNMHFTSVTRFSSIFKTKLSITFLPDLLE